MTEETDYRIISQQYAQGAIRAVILINAGAAIAILSQLTALLGILPAWAIGVSLMAYIVGISLGVLAWMFGFLSTRYVDKFMRREVRDYSEANKWQGKGTIVILLSLLTFMLSGLLLAWQFWQCQA